MAAWAHHFVCFRKLSNIRELPYNTSVRHKINSEKTFGFTRHAKSGLVGKRPVFVRIVHPPMTPIQKCLELHSL